MCTKYAYKCKSNEILVSYGKTNGRGEGVGS